MIQQNSTQEFLQYLLLPFSVFAFSVYIFMSNREFFILVFPLLIATVPFCEITREKEGFINLFYGMNVKYCCPVAFIEAITHPNGLMILFIGTS